AGGGSRKISRRFFSTTPLSRTASRNSLHLVGAGIRPPIKVAPPQHVRGRPEWPHRLTTREKTASLIRLKDKTTLRGYQGFSASTRVAALAAEKPSAPNQNSYGVGISRGPAQFLSPALHLPGKIPSELQGDAVPAGQAMPGAAHVQGRGRRRQ